MPSSTSIPIIVQGNSFSLAIPLQIYYINGDQMDLEDYTPDPTDEVTVQLKGSRRNYTYTPTIDGNVANIDLTGNELADNYGVVVSVVKANGQRLRSFRTDQFFIVESSDDLTPADIIEGLEENVIYLNSSIFVAGEDGRGITSIVKTSTAGLVDTYTITYSDNTTSTFDVTNGAAGEAGATIASVEKTATVGKVDTYTITMTDGSTFDFEVTNGLDGVDLGLANIVNDLTTGGATNVLSAEMGKVLGGAVYGEANTIDTSALSRINFYIDGNTNVWKSSTTYRGKMVDVSQYQGMRARIGNHLNNGSWWYRFAVLKDNYTAANNYPHYCDAWLGQQNHTGANEPQWIYLTIPNDCNYIFIYCGQDNQALEPQIDIYTTSGLINDVDDLKLSDANKLSHYVQPDGYELRNNGVRFWVNFKSIKPHNVFTAYPKNASYEVAYLGMASNAVDDVYTESSGWTTGFYNHKPVEGTVKFVINIRKANNTALTQDEALSNVVFSCVDGDTIDAVKEITHPYYERTYQGEPIDLQVNHYAVQDWGSYVNLANSQGMALYGGYIVQGRATESAGQTQCAIISLSTRTKVADLLLPHTGYSALHCNVMNFGEEISTGYTLPHLYVSQWDGETNCFVYDILTDGTATLKQVISASQITKDGENFGQGYVDWFVCGEYLLAVSYIGSGYSGGEIVTKFKLPAISDGAVINLTDADILDAKVLGDYTIRQDGCYHNGRLYILHGSTGQYVPQLALRVIDTSTLREVSVVDLQWAAAEPEGLVYYDNSLLLHYLNSDRLFRMLFS